MGSCRSSMMIPRAIDVQELQVADTCSTCRYGIKRNVDQLNVVGGQNRIRKALDKRVAQHPADSSQNGDDCQCKHQILHAFHRMLARTSFLQELSPNHRDLVLRRGRKPKTKGSNRFFRKLRGRTDFSEAPPGSATSTGWDRMAQLGCYLLPEVIVANDATSISLCANPGEQAIVNQVAKEVSIDFLSCRGVSTQFKIAGMLRNQCIVDSSCVVSAA